MNVRIERKQVMVDINDWVEFPLSSFQSGVDVDRVVATTYLTLPYNEKSLQFVAIMHVLDEDEMARQDAEFEDHVHGLLDDLPDE